MKVKSKKIKSKKIKSKSIKSKSIKSKSLKKDLDTSDPGPAKRKPSKAELKSVIELLQKEASLLLVRKALKYVPHYLKSEGLTKKLLKEIIRLWAESNEKIRIICLLCIIRIYTKLKDKEMRQLIIKKLYNSFLDKSRITKFETMSMIGFMRHSLVELYKIDPQIAFKQAQAACKQLEVTLKNATIHKNEETYKTVLNWQFANCLILLSQLITSHDNDSPVKSLTQQIVQLNLDAINLLMSPRYYPFYCHLIENLIHLSISANVFIPILPLIVTIINRMQLQEKKRPTKSSDDDDEDDDGEAKKEAKEYNIELLNHVNIDEAHSLEFSMAVLDKLYDLMVLYLANQCHRIAFPELVFLPSVQLKKWVKRNHGKVTQKFKVLLDKIKVDCEKIEESRRHVDFAFDDYTAVDAWEKRLKDSNKLNLPKMIQT